MVIGQNSRGVETHRRIIDATLEVIASEGVRAVTHRRVAAQARASAGLISYHFASTGELIDATLADLGRREVERLTALREQVLAADDDIDTLADLLVSEAPRWASDRRRDAISSMALTLEIVGSGVSRVDFAEWERAQFDLYEAVATKLGSSDPPAVATYLNGSLEGLAVFAAIAPDATDVIRSTRYGVVLLLTAIRDQS